MVSFANFSEANRGKTALYCSAGHIIVLCGVFSHPDGVAAIAALVSFHGLTADFCQAGQTCGVGLTMGFAS